MKTLINWLSVIMLLTVMSSAQAFKDLGNGYVMVQSGDTPGRIAAALCGGWKNHKLVWAGDPRKLPVGKIRMNGRCKLAANKIKPSETRLAKDVSRRSSRAGRKMQTAHEKAQTDEVLDRAAKIAAVSTRESADPNGFMSLGRTITTPHGMVELKAEGKAVVKAPTPQMETPVSTGGVYKWRQVGRSPLLTLSERKRWTRNMSLHPKMRAKLRSWGYSSSEISQIDDDLRSGRCNAEARSVGHVWKRMSYATGNKGLTSNSTGNTIMVWACPAVNGKQVDVAMRCANIAENIVSKTPPAVMQTPPKDVSLACRPEGTIWGAGHFGRVKGYAASVELACLVDLGNGWSAGPLLRASYGRFLALGWTEKTSYVGGGIRLRKKGAGWFDEVKFDLALGKGCAAGGTTDGNVKKPTMCGMDLWFSAYARKSGIEVVNNTTATIEIMPFLTVPLTVKSGAITWKGDEVDSEQRHPVAGVIGRIGFDDPDLPVVPEITVGGWHTFGVTENSNGGKALIGIAAKDRSWRVGAGVEVPNAHPIVEAEVNFGAAKLAREAKTARSTLTRGATKSCDHFGFGCKASKPPVKQQARVARTKAPKAKATMTASSEANGFASFYD